ncbi:hypothetical protein BD626DRAFT_201365 [Schizophyllum amplum]|uniref:Uncharacterized protein n=1 Tax=Schizophyllum amplum TaxID=97359 RepID=A0A550CNH0_9AGAR|nr:hypothetical protein BD626DRAFT_201365 [Auriculariopsis ampla]
MVSNTLLHPKSGTQKYDDERGRGIRARMQTLYTICVQCCSRLALLGRQRPPSPCARANSLPTASSPGANSSLTSSTPPVRTSPRRSSQSVLPPYTRRTRSALLRSV